MSGLGSDEAATKVHIGLDKDTKYRVCASILGQMWRASTDGDLPPLREDSQVELAKLLVRLLISNHYSNRQHRLHIPHVTYCSFTN